MRAGRLLALIAGLALAGCGDEDLGSGCPGSIPAAPDVSGMWTVRAPEFISSTCTNSINADLLALIVGLGASDLYHESAK